MPPLTPALRQEYEDLFRSCQIRSERASEIESTVNQILSGQSRYQTVAAATRVPWYFIGAIHSMECSCSFREHLHNGDPLTDRTVNVPIGRPKVWNPPSDWESSAKDSLNYEGYTGQSDWSLAAILYRFEAYNGWGYRGKGVNSPYLWSFSQLYTQGKYVADGIWSDTAVSQQCGAAVLLRRMVERSLVSFPSPLDPEHNIGPYVARYSTTTPTDPAVLSQAIALQHWLNTFPGVFLREDGICGDRTSETYRQVTGSYLPGDPRA